MKKLFYLASFCILLIPQSLLSQSLNHTIANSHTNVASGIAADNNGNWFVIGYSGALGVSPFFVLSDENNTIDNTYSIFLEEAGGEAISISEMVFDSISQLHYFAIARRGCDFILDTKLFFMDNSSFLPFSIDLDAGFGSTFHIDAVPGQGLLIAEDGGFEKRIMYYAFGPVINLINWPSQDRINHITHWSENRFFLSVENNLLDIHYTPDDQGGTIQDTIVIDNLVSTSKLNDSTLLVLHYHGLQVRNSSLEIEQEIIIPNASLLTFDTQYIYVVTPDSIHFLNHDFTEEAVISTGETRNYVIHDVAAQNGQIGLVGSSSYNSYSFIKPNSEAFMRSYSIEGTDIPSTSDVAVDNITYGSVDYTYSEFDAGCMSVEVSDIAITVKNMGTSFLEEVMLVDTKNGCEGWFICPIWTPISFGPFEVNLAPGESTSVNIDNLTAHYIQESSSYRLCLRAYAANGTMEDDRGNNRICENIQLVNITEPVISTNYSIAPTICSSEIRLTLDQINRNYSHVYIYNNYGQTVLVYPISTGTSTLTIDLSPLTTGSYFIRLKGDGLSSAKRFIKK